MEPTIEITKEFVKEKFKEYNALYFNGELKMPTVQIVTSHYFAMQFHWKKDKKTTALKRKSIWVNALVDWTYCDFRDTLVHEMIHYYIAEKHLYQHWLFDHTIGWFPIIKWRLNRKYGLHITNKCNVKLKAEA